MPDAYSKKHHQDWVKKFHPNRFEEKDKKGRTKTGLLILSVFVSIITILLSIILSVPFVAPIVILPIIGAWVFSERVFNPAPHVPKDEFDLTLAVKDHLIGQTNELNLTYPDRNRFHAFRTDKIGDQAKKDILDEFKTSIDQCKNLSQLRATVKTQINSPAYVKLATGQGVTTRFFALKTTSQEVYENICGKRAAELMSPSNI